MSTFCWPPPLPNSGGGGASTTDDISNTSFVVGSTATDALNTLNDGLAAVSNRPWLRYAGTTTSLSDREWTIGSGAAVFLPAATTAGMHCAVLVLLSDTNVSITCTLSIFQIGRSTYNAGSTVPVRPGAWYEWVSIDAGEDFRWIPVASGFDAKSPLEQSPASVAADPPPNQWILASDAAGVAHTPSSPRNGDSFAIFVDATTATIVPQTGQSILQADGGTLVTAPTSIAVLGSGYYEWIWIQSATTWFPRQNVLTPNLNGTQKQPVRIACTGNDSLSGLAPRDGVTPVVGDRVLAPFQTTTAACGIYLAASGAWTRAPDANTNAKVKAGLTVYVNEGTTYADTLFTLTTNDPIVLGTTGLTFAVAMRGTATPITIATLTAAAAGTSPKWAPIDHAHGMDSLYPAANNFRLSTQSSSSIGADGTFSTVYMVQHNGNRIALYDGTKWVDHVPASSNIVLSGMTSGVPQDIFAFSGGSRTLVSLEKQAWASATTRSNTLTTIDGVWVKSSSTTRRYLGTILADSSTTFSIATNPAGGVKAVCGLWNQDNRIQGTFQYSGPSGTASPGTPAVWATLPGMSAPHVELIVGQIFDSYAARALGAVSITTSGQQAAIGIGVDSTSAVQGVRNMSTGFGSAYTTTLAAQRSIKPAGVGTRTVNMLAQVSATGPTFIASQDLVQAGLIVDFLY